MRQKRRQADASGDQVKKIPIPVTQPDDRERIPRPIQAVQGVIILCLMNQAGWRLPTLAVGTTASPRIDRYRLFPEVGDFFLNPVESEG